MGSMIRIAGLKELRKGLKGIDQTLPRGIRIAGNIAAEIIVTRSKPRVPLGPAVNGHGRDSIRAASTQSAVGVAEGGAKYPYMPWLDFGGTINKHTGHPTVRRFYSDGRYIWDVWHSDHAEIVAVYQRELARLAESAGLDVS